MSSREQNKEERELEQLVTRLRDHGIIARTFDGILLSKKAAERLASMLDDLRRAEEGGHV